MSKFIARKLILAAALTGALAQSPTVPKQFDVVAIKPNTDNDNHFMFRPGRNSGSLTATGVTLKFLIAEVYDVWAYHVSGGPGWIGTERWDIRAKIEGAEGRLSVHQYNTMLRALLEDRFSLKIHSETKEMAVYALLVGKTGSKLTPHTDEPPSPEANRWGPGALSYKKFSTAAIARMLSLQLGRTVIDKTDLKGEFDFKLEWAHEPGQGGLESLGLPPDPPRPQPVDSNGPSIFTAVQEQLGLRLESRKGPVEIIVIDRAERPSEN